MDKYRIMPNTSVNLRKFECGETGAFKGDKRKCRKATQALREELVKLQDVLYAQHKHKVLVVLQAMDTGGKDGAVKGVFEGLNPVGVRAVSFKVPSLEELEHDYLWRIHRQMPVSGEIVIFNRSHYEDVLVVRVKNIVPPDVWGKRYGHICDFERMLVDSGTVILKFFLHIDKDEQKTRLQSRLDNQEKHWKFNVADLADRVLWDEFQRVYEEAISQTTTDDAPWYVVPANKKWYRDYVIARVMVDTLMSLSMSYPENKDNLSAVVLA